MKLVSCQIFFWGSRIDPIHVRSQSNFDTADVALTETNLDEADLVGIAVSVNLC